MNDFIEEYRNRVRKKLCRHESGSVVRMVEALCLPSFHPETLLRATENTEGAFLRLVTFDSSLWYSDGDDQPQRLQDTAAVPLKNAQQFWDHLDSLKPDQIRPSEVGGLDGMSVLVNYRVLDDVSSFEAWSPGPDTTEGQLIHLLYKLAWDRFSNDVSIQRMEQLHGYLHLGLPARIVNGELKTVRIFGSLSSRDESALQELFESVGAKERVVVDLTNFDGMGTLLYATFVDIASSGRRIAWAVSENARAHIEAMNLDDGNVFDQTEAAFEWMRREQI